MASKKGSADADIRAAMKIARARRGPKAKPPGPPTWPKDPRQDSYGNPTTKYFGGPGASPILRNGRWWDPEGRFGPRRVKVKS